MMKNLVVYSSLTGNTRKVAEAIAEVFGEAADLFPVENAPLADNYDVIAVGFWVDRGTADAKAQAYLQTLHGKKVALFGTLGAYPDSDHAAKSMANAAALLADDNTLLGTFICQGKVNPRLIEKFKDLPAGHPHAMSPEREARHREAAKHPDATDLLNAQALFREIARKAATHDGEGGGLGGQ